MKKWISLLLAALLLFPAGVSAPTGAASAFPEEPAAASEPAESEDTEPEAPAGEPEEIYTCETREEAIRFIRAQMTARVAAFSLRCADEAPITSEDIVAYEGSAPDEGDYLRFNIKDLRISAKNGEITVQAEYRTSAAQEQELNAVIAEILASCDFSALTDYQKALWAFDAVCDNVTYAAEDAGETAYTAYGALLEHKARCQGYALAYYRLARALGVDCRILVGEMTENGITNTHAWNAVKLGESWYYVDATGGDSADNRYEWFFSPLTGEGFEVNAQYDAGMGDDVFYTADEVREYTFNESIFGTCGDAVTWMLEPLTGLLRIDGEGEVKAFPDGELYWREYDKIISVAFIAPTVTALWDGSFEGCAYPLHAVPGSAAESCIMENALPHHTLTLTEEIPATCAETGRTEGWKCDACNIFFTGNELMPTTDDHSDADANDICDVCGLPLNYDFSGDCGESLHWYYYNRGELIVTGVGAMGNFNASGKNAAPWADLRTSIRTVTVWSGVETLGNNAFYNCTALTDISLPDTVTVIGNNAFFNCTALTEVTLPARLNKLGNKAFAKTALTSVAIPAALTDSHDVSSEGPFANSALETAVFEEGAQIVAYGLFASANNLKTVIFRTPETLQKIDKYAFCRCTSLTSVSLPDTVTEIGVNAFLNCTALTEMNLPAQLRTLSYNVFSGTKLTSVTIPASLTDVTHDYAYYKGPFADSALETAVFEEGASVVPADLFSKATSLKTVIFRTPETMERIGNYAFYTCTSLSSVFLPDTVTEIGNSAFSNCTAITEVTLPAQLRTLGYNAFSGTKFTSVTIPASLTAVTHDYAYNKGPFADSALETAVFEEGASAVPADLFSKATTLKTVIFRTPETMERIGNYAFYTCTSLSSVSLPDTVTEIGNSAFSNCTAIAGVTLPAQLRTLGYNAFSGTKFTSVTIPASLTAVTHDYAYNKGPFADSALETAVFEEGASAVPADLFSKATSLKTVIFRTPETVQKIGSYAFYGCTALGSFNVPENVTNIENSAFSGCTGLISVYIPSKQLTFGNNGFKSCSASLAVHCAEGGPAHTYAVKNNITCHTALTYETEPVTLCNGEQTASGAVYCTVCERMLTDNGTITPEGHVEAAIPAVKATCIAEGRTEGKKCRLCDTVLEAPEALPKTDHVPVTDPAVAPTCTKNGLTAGSHCACCKAVLVEREVVMAGGHFDTLNDGEVPDGICDICGKKTAESPLTYAIRRVGALFEGWLRLLSRLLRLFSKTKP